MRAPPCARDQCDQSAGPRHAQRGYVHARSVVASLAGLPAASGVLLRGEGDRWAGEEEVEGRGEEVAGRLAAGDEAPLPAPLPAPRLDDLLALLLLLPLRLLGRLPERLLERDLGRDLLLLLLPLLEPLSFGLGMTPPLLLVPLCAVPLAQP